MPSISIPDLTDDTYKDLCHLKIDWNCQNWSELMTKLVEAVGKKRSSPTPPAPGTQSQE